MIGQEAGQLRVRGDKTVNTVTRLGVSVMCSMDLALYPHDTQVGPWVFTSVHNILLILSRTTYK